MATQADSSARTTSATRTNTYRPITASTSSFGNLYHLNAEEEPERPYWPKDDVFVKTRNPRGVMQASADGKIEDTGPLTRKRMETIDDETTGAAIDFMTKPGEGEQAVLHLDELHAHAYLHACACIDAAARAACRAMNMPMA